LTNRFGLDFMTLDEYEDDDDDEDSLVQLIVYFKKNQISEVTTVYHQY